MDLQLLASQLRKPEGETGIRIGNMMNEGNRTLYQWAIGQLLLKEGDKLLEIGPGNGRHVSQLLHQYPGIQYEGIDYSEVMISEAQKCNAQGIAAGRVRFTPGSAAALPYEDHYFTNILAVNTLYFWELPQTELAEILRVLAPGGRFVLGIRSREAMEAMPFTRYGFIRYSREEVQDLLLRCGFDIEHILQDKEPPYTFDGKVIELENIVVTSTKNQRRNP